MKGINIIALFCILFSCAINAQTVGFKTTLSQRGINYLKDVGMQILQGQLSSLSIPDMSGRAETPVGHVSYSLSDIVLKGLTIPESNVTLTPPSSIQLTITNAQATMNLNWHYKEDSFPHVQDHGSADIDVVGTSISVVLALSEAAGRPSAVVSSCSVHIDHINVRVHGGGSWLYNWFISEFSGSIKSAAENAIQSQMPPAINKGLASALSTLPVEEPINTKIEINYALQSPPIVTPSYFTLAVLGEFFSVQNPHNAPFTPAQLPDIATTEMVQMFISDFTANSAAYVFFTDNVVHYLITDNMLPSNAPLRLNTTYFTELIPPLEKAYPNQMFELYIYATETPVATFSEQGASVVLSGAIEFVMLPSKTVAFTLGLKVLTSGSAALHGMNITAELTYINASLTLMNSTIGTFDVSVLQDIVGSLVIAMLPSANKVLGAGFPLPTIKGLTFENPQIGWGNRYMYISTDATYAPSAEDSLKATVTVN